MNRSAAGNVLPFPQHARPEAIAEAYDEGREDGMKQADERYFWMGMAAGVFLLLCIAAVLFLAGVFPA